MKALLKGQASLGSAYRVLILVLIVGWIVTGLIGSTIEPFKYSIVLTFALRAILLAIALVGVWQCARNAQSNWERRIARLVVIFCAVLFAAIAWASLLPVIVKW